MVEGGVDGLAVAHDAAGQLHEHRDAAAPRPGDPPVQGLLAFLAFDRKHMPQALFEQIGAIQPGIGLGDPGQLGGLAFGEVLGVFPQRIAGALELADPLMSWRGARCSCGAGRGRVWARCAPAPAHHSRPGAARHPAPRSPRPPHETDPHSGSRSGSVR